MASLKKVPKWVWVGGGIAAILAIILLYEKRNREEDFDPCDPETYDPELCPYPEDTSQHPTQQVAMPSGAAGGVNYYLPLGYGEAKSAPAQGSEDAVPTEPTETLVEPNPPAEGVSTGLPGSPPPGSPVPGSTPSEGLATAIPAPPGGVHENAPIQAPSTPSISPAQPVSSPVAVAPAQPAPSGWCGHPNAVGVGQPCSYKDNHNPPAGWHWFCCNGALGRAPN